MADSLINLLQTRTVLIRAGTSIGTGTLIANGMVLTCAHVVRKAYAKKKSIEVLLPNLTEPGQFIWNEKAQKVYISKKYEERIDSEEIHTNTEQIVLTSEYPDVAVIEIERKTHAIIAFPNNNIVLENLKDGQFLAFGFQKKDRDLHRNVPQAVSLNYNGEQRDGVIHKLIFDNGLIRPGMSGAALLERENGQIVGIIHMTKNPNDDLGAYVIPIQTIWSVIEKWENEGVTQLFSVLKSKKLKTLVQKQYREEYPRFPLFKKYGIRLFILPVLLFLALWWVFFHLGFIQDSGIVSILLVAISLSGKIIGDWLGKDANRESKKLKSNIGKVLFSTTFLIGFSVIIALLWTFTSSVWVYGNPKSDKIPIVFSSDAKWNYSYTKNLNSKGKTRFLMFSTPKGDSITLMPEGREAKEMRVQSFSKQEFYFPDDFFLEPAFIIRFNPTYPKRSLMNEYQVKIRIERFEEKIVDTVFNPLKNTGSITFGRKIDVKKRAANWEEELRRDRTINNNDEVIESILKIWENTEHIGSLVIKKGDIIKVQVIYKEKDSIFNKDRYTVRGDFTKNDKLLNFTEQ